MDFSAIAEEIALEGLDGITLEALWKRLESRPGFVDGQLDDDCKRFIWKCVSSVQDFSFYCLQEPRPELVIFRYTDNIDSEGCKCVLPVNTPPDIYSHKMIDRAGVWGCCDHFESRQNVTEEVRTSDGSCLMSLDEITMRWAQCFVIVASQRQRNLALLGSSSLPSDMGVEIYCILESVGRSRYEGEVTYCRYARGLSSPKFPEFGQSTSAFARVKSLSKLGYVTKQPFTLKYLSPASYIQVRLVHLRRFYRATKANLRGGLQALNSYLLSKPGHIALYTDVMKDLNLKFTFFKNKARLLQDFFSSEIVNYSDVFPGAKDLKTKKGVEKKVRVVRLLKPFHDVGYFDDDDDDDEEDDDDDFEDNEDTHKTDTDDDRVEDMDQEPEKKKPDPVFGNLSYHHSILSQIVRCVARSGERGLFEREVMNKLNLGRIATRCGVKQLLKTKSVASITRALQRNNVHTLVTPEVAERLKNKKKMEDVNVGSAVDASAVTEVQESSALCEETGACPSEEQVTDKPVEELDIQLNNIDITCTLDRAQPPFKPALKREENDKKLARKKFIIKELSQKKVFSSTRNLYLEICDGEKKRGLKEQMCRKSFKRILKELYDEGQISYAKICEKTKPDKVLQQMVLDPNITLQDCRVKEALLLSSPYFMRLDGKGVTDPANKSMDSSVADLAETPSSSSLEKSAVRAASTSKSGTNKKSVPTPMVSVCQMLDKSGASPVDKQSNVAKSKRRMYCPVPKFKRAKLLHKYMFYLLYGYEGSMDASSQETVDESCSETPRVYLDVDDWRRHLPPLKKHNEAYLAGVAMDGVCMTGDLLLNMPLNLFCNIISRPWEVEGLSDFLNDPVRKNYPMCNVPQPILSKMLIRRTYLFKLQESLNMLCHLGLLTFGTKTASRELEFISFYLHKKAVVLDTRKSNPGYLMTSCPEGEMFERLHYHFKSMDDLNNYWKDVKIIALNSKLGSYSVDDAKGNHGTVSLLEVIQPAPLHEVKEDNWLPGDQRGAGGFDSSLHFHRFTSWIPKESRGKQKSSIGALSSESKNNEGHRQDGPLAKKRKTSEEALPERGMSKSFKKNVKKGKQKRRAKPAMDKKEKINTMDDVDRQAKLNMRRQRAYFSPLENGLLLLSQVASCILSPRTGVCVKSTVIRDILQEQLPESKDKTAMSVKGKMARLLREENFRVHLVTYITQAQSDKKLMEKYKEKRGTIHSPEMEKQFRQLHQDLWKKFSSPKSSQTMPLPASVVELMNQYEVKNTRDILYKNPKMSKDVLCEDDVKEIVVWELLESFLHLTKPLSSAEVYYTLSRFPDEIIHKAFTGLKTCGVLVQMKKQEKDRCQIVNRSALLNNHKSTLRHRDAMKARYPVDLFWNLKGQIEALVNIKPTGAASSMSGSGEMNAAFQDILGQSEQTERSSENENSVMDTEVTGLGAEIGPSTSGQRNEMNSVQRIQQDCNHDDDDEVEEAAYRSLDIKKFQGGSVLTLLSLTNMGLLSIKVDVPDEMVKLDDEGKRKLYFKQPSNKQQLKRKHDDTDENPWPVTERDSYQHKRSGQKQPRELKMPRVDQSAMKRNEQASTSKPSLQSPVEETERCLKLRDIILKMRVLKTIASDVFENFTVWVASGSLLTIARTSLIESLDLLNSKCLLQRNFIVEPLDIKCALKVKAFHKPEVAENKIEESPASEVQKPDSNDEIKIETDSVNSDTQKSRSDLKMGSVPVKTSNSGTTCLENSRFWCPKESYMDLIHHLEKCFSPEMNNDDVLLDQIIPPESLEKGLSLFQLIDSSGDLGITETDLERKLSTSIRQIKPLLRFLMRADAVFKVGSTQRRYVSRRHAKIWFVEVPVSSEVLRGSQGHGAEVAAADVTAAGARAGSIVYQCRLWRHFNGRLNWQGLQTVLQRVMTYLMAHPGCSLCRLCHVLNPDVLPATTMDVVDILEDIGCVEVLRIKKHANPTLFSTRKRGLSIGDNISLEESVTVINVLIEAPIKLAYFLDLAIQHCQ